MVLSKLSLKIHEQVNILSSQQFGKISKRLHKLEANIKLKRSNLATSEGSLAVVLTASRTGNMSLILTFPLLVAKT